MMAGLQVALPEDGRPPLTRHIPKGHLQCTSILPLNAAWQVQSCSGLLHPDALLERACLVRRQLSCCRELILSRFFAIWPQAACTPAMMQMLFCD